MTSFIKAAGYGKNGSGKSGTVVRLAVGLALEYCDKAPVVVSDTEDRWRFYDPVIFQVEGVKLHRVTGKSIAAVQDSLAKAREVSAGVWVGDQLTTPWKEGLEAFSYDDGTLPFNRRQQLMNQWEPVIDGFRYGKFHSLALGRLGFFWQNLEDDAGNVQLQQGDSKFNAGGGENFGYEADLEFEMHRRKVLRGLKLGNLLRGRLQVEHVCDIVKDAAAGVLNGKQFVFPSQEGLYKKGDYKPVLDAFRPYIDFMLKVPAAEQARSSTRNALVSGQTPWAQAQTERKALLEELSDLLDFCFPGGTGKSALANAFKKLTLEYLSGSSAWARLESEAPLEELRAHKGILLAMRKRIEAGEIPNTQREVMTLLDLSTDDTAGGPAKNMTLLEAMGVRSLQQIRGVQPVNGKAAVETAVSGGPADPF